MKMLLVLIGSILLCAWAFWAANAQAGKMVTAHVQNEFGNSVPTPFYDVSGKGQGPYARVVVPMGADGNIGPALPMSGTGGFFGASIGQAVSSDVVQPGKHNALSFRNESRPGSGALVAICPDTLPSPAIYAPGCYTLAPHEAVSWSGNYVPADGFNALASAENTPVTIEAH